MTARITSVVGRKGGSGRGDVGVSKTCRRG